MTRYIAILTMALTAALSADESFATLTIDFNDARPDIYADDLDALIAIIAFHAGPEAAYLTLRDMGFTHREAKAIVLEMPVEKDAYSQWDRMIIIIAPGKGWSPSPPYVLGQANGKTQGF